MQRKEDVRITKTKRALAGAFFDMLKDTPLHDISINELCIRADVRRATFYKHFKDKNDFIIHLIKDVRTRFNDEAREVSPSPEDIKAFYLKCAESIINYLMRYEEPIKNIINSEVRPTFIEMLARQNYVDTVHRLKKCEDEGMTLFATPEVVAGMLIGGASHTIVHWFEKDEHSPVEELLDSISQFITRVLD